MGISCYKFSWIQLLCVCVLASSVGVALLKLRACFSPRVLSCVMNLSDTYGIMVCGLLVLQSHREGSVLKQIYLWCMELDVDIGMYLLRNRDNNWD